MRSVGIVCLALGIILMVCSLFPIIFAEGPGHVFLGLGCSAFLAIPLIVVGILFTRHAAKRSGPKGEAEASAAFLKGGATALGLMLTTLGGSSHVKKLDKLPSPDLNRMTFAGWLLTLSTLMLFVTLLLLWAPPPADSRQHWLTWGTIRGPLLAAACFALVGYSLLRLRGVRVLRPRNSSLEKDNEEGR